MIKAIVSDFSRTLLFAKDPHYTGSINKMYRELLNTQEFKFFDHYIWNKQLAEFYQDIKVTKNIPIYIFTTEKIQENSEVKKYTDQLFTTIYTIKDVGNITKDNPQAYKKLLELIKLSPGEVIFIDDSEVNVSAAKQVGLNCVMYTQLEQVKQSIQNYFN